MRTPVRRSRLSAAGSSVLSCSQCAVSVRWARTVLRCWSRSSTLLGMSPLELAVLQSMSRPLNIVRPRDEEANPALNDLGSRQVRCCADLPKPPCTSSDQSSTRRNAFLGRTTTQKNRRTSCLVWSSTLQRGPQRMNDFTTVERISSWYEQCLSVLMKASFTQLLEFVPVSNVKLCTFTLTVSPESESVEQNGTVCVAAFCAGRALLDGVVSVAALCAVRFLAEDPTHETTNTTRVESRRCRDGTRTFEPVCVPVLLGRVSASIERFHAARWRAAEVDGTATAAKLGWPFQKKKKTGWRGNRDDQSAPSLRCTLIDRSSWTALQLVGVTVKRLHLTRQRPRQACTGIRHVVRTWSNGRQLRGRSVLGALCEGCRSVLCVRRGWDSTHHVARARSLPRMDEKE